MMAAKAFALAVALAVAYWVTGPTEEAPCHTDLECALAHPDYFDDED